MQYIQGDFATNRTLEDASKPRKVKHTAKICEKCRHIKEPKSKAEAQINLSEIMCETRYTNRGVERMVDEAVYDYSNTYRKVGLCLVKVEADIVAA